MWASIENPYLALILPVAAALSWLKERRLPLAVGTLVGCLGTLGISRLFAASANPNYPNARAGEWYRLGPWRIEIVDVPWARASLHELFWPTELSWTLDANTGVDASGGLYLGWSLLALAGVGAVLNWRRAWPWVAGCVAALLLALGSFPGGPVVVLNGLMNAFLRPLTQPTRVLVMTSISLSILGAFGLDALRQRLNSKALILLSIVALDALLLGGLSLSPPTQPLPSPDCIVGLEGGVLIWPKDGRMGDPSQARMLQMLHEQPAPHSGIASWRLNQEDIHPTLERHGFGEPPKAGGLNWKPIMELGYRNLVLLPHGPRLPIKMPEPVCQTSELAVYRLEDLPNQAVIR
jgi:hypothetical protein